MENDGNSYVTDISKPLVIAVSAAAAFLLLAVVIAVCVFRRKREVTTRGVSTLLRSVTDSRPERDAETGSSNVRTTTLSVTPDDNVYANVDVCQNQKRPQYISMHVHTADYAHMSRTAKRSERNVFKSRSCVVSSEAKDKQKDSEPIYLNTQFPPRKTKTKKKGRRAEDEENPYVN